MNVRSIIISWDFLVAAIVAALLWILLPLTIDHDLAANLYSVGISVLAIIFSVFFAALAIIISSGDNEFIDFMEEDGGFTDLVSMFRFSLITLFVALAYSVVLYVLTSFWASQKQPDQHKLWMIGFCWLFCYSMFSTAISSLDTVKFAKYRVMFLRHLRRAGKSTQRRSDQGNTRSDRAS